MIYRPWKHGQKKWMFLFNAAKCKIMHMGRDSGASYHLRDSNEQRELIETELERDLGILVRDRKSVV